MMNTRNLTTLVVILIMLAGGFACSSIPFLNSEPEPPTHVHFEDVLVPSELNLNRNRSFVFETQGFKAGTLYFRGYVEPDSVADFFKAHMPKDGWQLKSIFRHPKTVLLFEKPQKNCIITIYEETVFTYVEIWVAPQT